MKDKVHTLPSFATYINKVFAFRSHLPGLAITYDEKLHS